MTVQNAIANSTTWRDAVHDLISFHVENNQAFSSGEISRDLRVHRPDLRFSSLSVGNYVRDLFYGGGMPSYTLQDGTQAYPYQVSRITEGTERTPAGIPVFVYCPDDTTGYAHDFEVHIPNPMGSPQTLVPLTPQQQVTYQNTQQAVQSSQLTPQASKAPVKLAGKPTQVDLIAKVHSDRRLCIPRSAFEAHVHMKGAPLQGGDPVFITFSNTYNEVAVTTDPVNSDSKSYDLSVTRGRILFPMPIGQPPFAPDKEYDIEISREGLLVRL